MSQTTVGIRELKSRLSHYLRQVKGGATLIITERGRPIGRIVPAGLPPEDRLETMVEAGLVAWSGRSLPSTRPVATTRGQRTVADLLLEDRE
ncbi:MAG: type II toxin-antitoxin system Phd/YefM family antitoxin [Anaerolineae bacterium]